jgi:hypothetical protein
MARRALLLAALAAVVSGCGQADYASLAERGLKELRSGNYDEAIATCTEAIGQNPQDPEAYLYRAKAYHFRNAMGDSSRALADLGQTIRLAPESADGYYTRALVYRDLGKKDLELADDAKARELDGQLQSIYRQLPEEPLPSGAPPPATASAEPAAAQPTAADSLALPKSERDQRALFETLKERFEPKDTSLFGEKRNSKESPSARRRERRPQERLERILPTVEADRLPGGDFGVVGDFVPRSPLQTEPARPLSQEPSPTQTPLRSPRSVSSPFQPPTAPLLPDELGRTPAAGIGRTVQSPFGQRAPAPTGYGVQPVNPFSQRPLAPNQLPRTVTPDSAPVRRSDPADYIP